MKAAKTEGNNALPGLLATVLGFGSTPGGGDTKKEATTNYMESDSEDLQ